jgi:hypothetical protein
MLLTAVPAPPAADYHGLRRCIQICRNVYVMCHRLCGLVVRDPGHRSRGPGSIPGTTRIKKSSGSGTGSTQPREYN